MKKTFKFLYLILALIFGYFFGHLFPIEILKPEFPDDQFLTKSEYYRFTVSVISAVITFSAVLVAMFKDDLREYWKRPILKIIAAEQATIEELNTKSESSSSTDNLVATKYISRIEIKNEGNLPSINTEIFIESLNFKPKDTNISQSIECDGKPIIWNGSESTSMILPVGAKKLINIVMVSAPEKVSTPDSGATTKPSSIIIGGIKNKKEQTKGTWTAKFGVYAQNHKPIYFEVEMIWNGVWTSRLTEYANHYQFKKIN